ncbi:MAG: P1 family peptidase [Anaerolineaceae bacterium]|nr:P1 family peptidase [Anaerolineaceae bacterium]
MKKFFALVGLIFITLFPVTAAIAAGESGSEERIWPMDHIQEIPITEIENIRIGQAENAGAGTGLTVFISENGMAAGLDVRGGGPASRESELLKPLAAAQVVHAVVLSGGSAFGLGAGNGVMQYLEEHGIGFDVVVTKVPLVVQSDLFDLTVGDPFIRPDAAMGYEAARRAMEDPNYQDGNHGAGTGATVGKFGGMETCMKSGIGSYAVRIGDLKIGAVVAVNAIGDIYDWKTGQKTAGLLTPDKTAFRDSMELMTASTDVVDNRFVENTTLGVIITNASFTKSQLCKIAGMAHDGYARSIRPVHTTVDGDSIYALSVGEISADQDLVGALAAEVMSEAILRAVLSADSAYGFPAAKDLEWLNNR